jgi:integrase/recombinase XerC
MRENGYNVRSRIKIGVDAINSQRLLEQFEAHLLSLALSPATVINYMADLRAFLRWSEETYGTDRSPLHLDAQSLQRFCSFLQKKDHAPATINRRIQTLRKFYSFALAQGWVLSNPAEDVPLLSETASQRSRHLTEDDVSCLLAAVRKGHRRWAHRDWAIMQVLVGAGVKLSELTELQLNDVHLDGTQPSLHICGNSNGLERTVPLKDEVCEALRTYLASRRAAPEVKALFINRDGNPLSTRSVQRLLRHYARAAELDGLTTQALRYVYARRLYEGCGDLETVTRLLGHRHMATTVRYLRPELEEYE